MWVGQPASHAAMSFCETDTLYARLVRRVLADGALRHGRTADAYYELFGGMLTIDLRDNKIPLLTTKKLFVRGVIEELLFFLRGQTDTHVLRDKGVHIWDGNTTRAFLDGRGLQDYREGDMGPMVSGATVAVATFTAPTLTRKRSMAFSGGTLARPTGAARPTTRARAWTSCSA